MSAIVHESAHVENGVTLGENVRVWHQAHVRTGAKLGKNVSVGGKSYIDVNVTIGEGTRIQNGVNVFQGVQVATFCFIGPEVVFTNDLTPRVGNKSWKIVPTIIENGASIGAGAVIRCGISVGAFSLVAAGSVVTKSVPPFTMAIGLPAEFRKRVCACAQTTLPLSVTPEELIRPCCKEMMGEPTFKLAQLEVKKLADNSDWKATYQE